MKRMLRPLGRMALLLTLLSAAREAAAVQIFSGNVLRFSADQGALNALNAPAVNGEAVATWEDLSSSGFDVTQPTAGKRPTYVASSVTLNGQAAIQFSNLGGASGADSLSNTLNDPVTNTQARTLLIAGQAGPTSEGGSLFTFRRTTLIDTMSLMNLTGTFYIYSDGVSSANNTTIPNPSNATRDEIRSPFVSVHKATPGTTPTLTPMAVDLNGLARPVTTGSATGGVSSETGNTGFTVGGRADQAGGTLDWTGLIGEVLVYDRVLNTAETVIATNYLSAKYGTALADNDVYQGDSPTKNDYDFEVFGVGRDAASNASPAGDVLVGTAGTGLTLSADSATLANGEYVLAGQRLGANAWTTDDMPEGGRERWSRVWYIEETGEIGATLTFDFSDGGVSLPANWEEVALLFSPTDPYSFTPLAITGVPLGDQISFEVNPLQLQSGYYTLATFIVPEPASLGWLLAGASAIVIRRRRRLPS